MHARAHIRAQARTQGRDVVDRRGPFRRRGERRRGGGGNKVRLGVADAAAGSCGSHPTRRLAVRPSTGVRTEGRVLLTRSQGARPAARREHRPVTLETCSCGHAPAEHVIAADSSGPHIYECEAWIAPERLCDCRQFSPHDPQIDDELPWKAA
jgi:hypothetical protein